MGHTDLKVNKAIVTAAGKGTRFQPFTNVIQKEFLPIIDKPIIQYVIDELVESDIHEIIIVTEDKSKIIENYIRRLPYEGVSFLFIPQDQTLPYGNGSPILSARRFVGNDPFVVCFGDDITSSRTPIAKQLVTFMNNYTGHVSATVALQRMEREEICKYASVEFKQDSVQLKRIIEKPNINQIKTSVASYGRYVFTKDIWDYLKPTNTGKNDELWLVDAIRDMIADKKTVLGCKTKGRWLTTGDPVSYLYTCMYMGVQHQRYGPEILKFVDFSS